MKKLNSFSTKILIALIFFAFSSSVIAQKDKNISIQVAPLISYMQIVYGTNTYTGLIGVNDPKLGVSSTIKFEISLNNTFSVNTGLSYQIRNNAYETGMLYDTSVTGYNTADWPYKYTHSAIYKFVGVPLGISVNYLNNSKLRIYQSFATELSFILSAKYKGSVFYKDEDTENFNYSNKDEGNNKVLYSLSSSIGICKYLNSNWAIKFEPGFNYMINHFSDDSNELKYFDFKIDVGVIYKL